MVYCKRCPCGFVNKYENMGGAPLRCAKCSRFIAAVTEELYVEHAVPAVEQSGGGESLQPVEQTTEQVTEQTAEHTTEPITEQPEEKPAVQPKGFVVTLESHDGSLVLPVTAPVTVGRNAAGKEYLGIYADVSREHFTIAPRANGITATLTDISSWGTYVNGTRLIRGASVAVSNYTEIRLASRAVMIVRVKEVDTNA